MTQCRLHPSGLCIDPVRQCFVRKSLPLFATTSTYDPGTAQPAQPSLDTQANPSALPTITVAAPARAYDSATATKTDTANHRNPAIDLCRSQRPTGDLGRLDISADANSDTHGNFDGYDIIYSCGFPVRRYLDGMRLQGDSGFVTPQVDLRDMERTELLRRPAAVLFGRGTQGAHRRRECKDHMLERVRVGPVAIVVPAISWAHPHQKGGAAIPCTGPLSASPIKTRDLVSAALAPMSSSQRERRASSPGTALGTAPHVISAHYRAEASRVTPHRLPLS
jgi:hypothetical protein